MAPDQCLDRRQWAGLLAMMAGMFIAILDIQIVAASLADIQAGLSASPDEGSWIQTSYLIAEVVMIPLSGWLSRLLSTRILFAASALGFTLFSLVCSVASTMEQMILFRAGQGFFGGAMIPTVFATVFLVFTGARQARMSMLIGIAATMAPTIGPSLGGWLTANYSWHVLFLINVPLGLTIATVVWKNVDVDRPDWSLRHTLDRRGVLAMALFLGSLQYLLEEGSHWGWLEDQRIVWASVICAASGAVFIGRMLTRRDPIVDLRAFANSNFALGSLFSFVLGIGLYGSSYLVPMFLARVRGYDSLQIGETMFVAGISMFLGTPVAGWLMRRFDVRVVLGVGLTMFGISLWWMGTLTTNSGFADFILPQALRGASVLFVMLPTSQIALGRLPPHCVKNASSLYNLMRNLGGAFGLAAIDTVSRWRLAHHQQHLAEQVTWARPVASATIDRLTPMLAAEKGSESYLTALKYVSAQVERQALTLSCNDVLLLMGSCFLIAIPLVVLLSKPAERVQAKA